MQEYKYIMLNENKIASTMCTYGQPLLNIPDNYIQVQDSTMLWHKYENGQWSTEKFEPISSAPINEFEAMKQQVDALNIAMANMMGV